MFKKVFQNKVIRTMVVVEFFFAIAFGVFSPMFAIFAADNIIGGSAKVVGFAMAIFWMTKAIFQLPVAKYLDKIKGEKDDFYAYFIGQLLFALGMMLYVWARVPTHVYALQALLGLAFAINIPAFYGLFSRHLDKNYESSEWSVYSVISYSVGVAIAGALSGIIVDSFGFDKLFIFSSSFFFLSALVNLFILRPFIYGRSEKPPVNTPGVLERDFEK